MHRHPADGTRAAPVAEPRLLSSPASGAGELARYYPVFPQAIPVHGARRPRVTHQSAALIPSKLGNPARLACLRRAASVRSEPGSNSPSCILLARRPEAFLSSCRVHLLFCLPSVPSLSNDHADMLSCQRILIYNTPASLSSVRRMFFKYFHFFPRGPSRALRRILRASASGHKKNHGGGYGKGLMEHIGLAGNSNGNRREHPGTGNLDDAERRNGCHVFDSHHAGSGPPGTKLFKETRYRAHVRPSAGNVASRKRTAVWALRACRKLSLALRVFAWSQRLHFLLLKKTQKLMSNGRCGHVASCRLLFEFLFARDGSHFPLCGKTQKLRILGVVGMSQAALALRVFAWSQRLHFLLLKKTQKLMSNGRCGHVASCRLLFEFLFARDGSHFPLCGKTQKLRILGVAGIGFCSRRRVAAAVGKNGAIPQRG